MNHKLPSSCEAAVDKIIKQLQPSKASEARRSDIVEHIQKTLRMQLGLYSYLFGSVSYKTYLPDGDIDIMVSCPLTNETEVLHRIQAALELNPEKRPTDTQIVMAEVKLFKMTMQGMYIDISVNQIGGMSTTCFLHEVDNFIGRQHLFKRALILVKSWCYYESHVMGSGGGLIGTYAITIMLLCVFNVFNNINTPLQAFLQFLKYFSRFPFEEQCLTIYGPTSSDARGHQISIPVDPEFKENIRNGLLIPHDIIRKWRSEYGTTIAPMPSPPPSGLNSESNSPRQQVDDTDSTADTANQDEYSNPETTPCETLESSSVASADTNMSRYSNTATTNVQEEMDQEWDSEDEQSWKKFQFRTINVRDPLRLGNNLGKSVSRSNLYRIRRAFKKGYEDLENIIKAARQDTSAPTDHKLKKIEEFFPRVVKACQRAEKIAANLSYEYESSRPPVGLSLFDRMNETEPVTDIGPICSQCQKAVGSAVFCVNIDYLKDNLDQCRALQKMSMGHPHAVPYSYPSIPSYPPSYIPNYPSAIYPNPYPSYIPPPTTNTSLASRLGKVSPAGANPISFGRSKPPPPRPRRGNSWIGTPNTAPWSASPYGSTYYCNSYPETTCENWNSEESYAHPPPPPPLPPQTTTSNPPISHHHQHQHKEPMRRPCIPLDGWGSGPIHEMSKPNSTNSNYNPQMIPYAKLQTKLM